ncbi:MAG: DUF4369 domain-containing protein [Bacteroidaceae bacterium]
MRKLLYTIICLLLICSCTEQYNIAGNSSVTTLDGRMLYLKIVNHNDRMNSIDSCEVIHGKFNFMGLMDSTVMAELYMDNESVMPVVIENGDLTIRIDNVEQRVFGGALNDKLYKFIEKKYNLENELNDLSHKELRLIMNGESPDVVHHRLLEEAKRLNNQIEMLEINFITKNYDNILGPEVFMLLCSQYRYPMLEPQIQKIIDKATPRFKKHPYVREYLRVVKENSQDSTHIKFVRRCP